MRLGLKWSKKGPIGWFFSLLEESVLHGNVSHCMSDITMNKSGRAMESRITIKTSKVGIQQQGRGLDYSL